MTEEKINDWVKNLSQKDIQYYIEYINYQKSKLCNDSFEDFMMKAEYEYTIKVLKSKLQDPYIKVNMIFIKPS
uniref:PH domain-containing protein n=1 Tax=viral metagenome TaxID=1070528 RepID=A0A6C0AFJ2_9ZZZZ